MPIGVIIAGIICLVIIAKIGILRYFAITLGLLGLIYLIGGMFFFFYD